jgi:hypothetical protein
VRASKICITICGAKVQASWPGLKRRKKSPLAVPNAAVNEIQRKKVARAAPILALAALSRFFSLKNIRAAQEHPG